MKITSVKDLNFRQNVDPSFRRATNKNISEFKRLNEQYHQAKLLLEDAQSSLDSQTKITAVAEKNYESSAKKLADLQAIIDGDHLPEGAQPVKRIKNRNKVKEHTQALLEVAEKERIVLARKDEYLKQLEHDFFLIDTSYNRFGSTIQSAMANHKKISEADLIKVEKIQDINVKTQMLKEKKIMINKYEETNNISLNNGKTVSYPSSDQTLSQRTKKLFEKRFSKGKHAVLAELDRFTETLDTKIKGTRTENSGLAVDGDKTVEKLETEDSSDEEWKIPEKTKESKTNYAFYEFGKSETPLSDILDKISSVKTQSRLKQPETLSKSFSINSSAGEDCPTRDYVNIEDKLNSLKSDPIENDILLTGTIPSGTKKFSIETFKTKQVQKFKNDYGQRLHKISQFRPVESLWDGSFTLNDKLQKELYRVPCRDPSGKVIFSLTRDLAKGKVWKAVEGDKDFKTLDISSCANPFQELVEKTVDQAVAKLEEEYKNFPDKPQRNSNLKASLGADLNNLRKKQKQIKNDKKLHRHHFKALTLADTEKNNILKVAETQIAVKEDVNVKEMFDSLEQESTKEDVDINSQEEQLAPNNGISDALDEEIGAVKKEGKTQ